MLIASKSEIVVVMYFSLFGEFLFSIVSSQMYFEKFPNYSWVLMKKSAFVTAEYTFSLL
ncbi:hypothetical protein QO200_09515 [Flavobacterium sp. Arc3]|uniref:hypothetical protein n=1 Tax=Flavobacterium sp. Arc3 TaxID=3046686 RepID=UPI00352EF8E5